MPSMPEILCRELIWERFRLGFTSAPVVRSDQEFDPTDTEDLAAPDPQPSGPFTIENVRENIGYVQMIFEVLESSSARLSSGEVQGVLRRPEILRFAVRFASVTPSVTEDDFILARWKEISDLYMYGSLRDPSHVDWPDLQVHNRPMNDGGTAWRFGLQRDIANGWRNDSATGDFDALAFRDLAGLIEIDTTP